jgi:hypothetical protein
VFSLVKIVPPIFIKTIITQFNYLCKKELLQRAKPRSSKQVEVMHDRQLAGDHSSGDKQKRPVEVDNENLTIMEAEK